MPDDLYDRHILEWSKRQADRLRRLAAGERVNDLDWEHVIEEIEDLGLSEFRQVESLFLQALLHALKAAAWPDHDAVRHWRHEVANVLLQARRRMQPSMRRRLDVAEMYAEALATVRDLDMDAPPRPLPDAAPVTAEDLADHGLAASALIARLGAMRPERPNPNAVHFGWPGA
jgi:hypothetical protein